MRKILSGVFVFLLLLTSTACQPLRATVPPTPTAIKIQYSVALQNWATHLNTCAQTLSYAGLVTTEIPAAQINLDTVDFALRFGPASLSPSLTSAAQSATNSPTANSSSTPSSFSVVVGQDEIVMVVNPYHSTLVLTPQLVTNIYSGKFTSWKGANEPQATSSATESATAANQAIQAWAYPVGDDLRQVFDAAFLPTSAMASSIHLAPDQEAMIEALEKDSNAIGFMLKSQVPASLKAINLIETPAFSLLQPILAISRHEPQNAVRQMILCLQSK